jgi:hypothetical protein
MKQTACTIILSLLLSAASRAQHKTSSPAQQYQALLKEYQSASSGAVKADGRGK